MSLVGRHFVAVVAAAAVALIGLSIFLVWRGVQEDRRAERVDTQASALRDSTSAVFGQIIARTNFVRGAVEASGRPELLDDAFAVTVAWGASAGAAVVDIDADGRTRVLRRTGTTHLLEQTLALPLPPQEDQPVLMSASARGGNIRIAHVSRIQDRMVYHESTLGPRMVATLTEGFDAIDFELAATPLTGEETVILRHPANATVDADAETQDISELGINAEMRIEPAASLPPAVSPGQALVWGLLIISSALGAALAAGVYQGRKRELERKSVRERELLFKSNHDGLTGLPNRTALFDHLENLSEGLVSLLFVDLDGFKAVNDGYGHDTGDRVLTVVAQRLRDSMRKPDLVFRLGGDEFVVVSDSKEVSTLKSRIERVLDVPVEVGDDYASISASIGAAVVNGGEDLDVRAALRAADRAMYEDKAMRKAMNTLDQAGEI